MNKILLIVLLISAISTTHTDPDATNGTQSYFLSPHGLGKTPEVSVALNAIRTNVKVATTEYNHSDITYVLQNFLVEMSYNDGQQKVQIVDREDVLVSGGRIQFSYKFNFSRTFNKTTVKGTGSGSVLSDSLKYRKQMAFNSQSYLFWILVPGKGVQNLTIIQNRFKIKRLDPHSEGDIEAMTDMLDKAFSAIKPSNVEIQILQIFNSIFPLALNESLNHQVFGETIPYVYHSETHGEMKMNITKRLFDFGIDKELGYKAIFVSEIENWDEPICSITVNEKPYSFAMYGGSQNFHLHCLYESVVLYMQSNGWLNTKLNDNWQCNAFQFYAGDLFDLINNLYLTVKPISLLEGECVALKDGIKWMPSRQFVSNTYALDVNYNCTIRTTTTQGVTAEIVRFNTAAKFYIVAEATTKTLSFKILFAELLTMQFIPVGNYFVTNANLALFKANQVMKKLINHFTFGTNFPTITRAVPKTLIEKDWAFYYDASHIEGVESMM